MKKFNLFFLKNQEYVSPGTLIEPSIINKKPMIVNVIDSDESEDTGSDF